MQIKYATSSAQIVQSQCLDPRILKVNCILLVHFKHELNTDHLWFVLTTIPNAYSPSSSKTLNQVPDVKNNMI